MLKLFISHSSKDISVVEPLLDLLRSALNLSVSQIRCTSVDGYRLPGGADTDEQLRAEVNDSEAFIGLISNESIDSMYVIFELGARWGVKKHLLPVLSPGTPANVLVGPLRNLNALRLDSAAQIHQLVTDLGSTLRISPQSPAAYQKHINTILDSGECMRNSVLSVQNRKLPSDSESKDSDEGPGKEAWDDLFGKLFDGGKKFQNGLLSQVSEIKNSEASTEKRIQKLKLIFQVELDEVKASLARDEQKPEKDSGVTGIAMALINKAVRQKKQALDASVKILEATSEKDDIDEVFSDVEDAIRTFTSD